MRKRGRRKTMRDFLFKEEGRRSNQREKNYRIVR